MYQEICDKQASWVQSLFQRMLSILEGEVQVLAHEVPHMRERHREDVEVRC